MTNARAATIDSSSYQVYTPRSVLSLAVEGLDAADQS